MTDAFIHDAALEDSLGHGGLDAAKPANRVNGAQVVFVPLLGRQTAFQRDAQTRTVKRVFDVVRGQGVAREEDIQVAGADELADMVDTSRMDYGRTQHGENLVVGGG